MNYQKYIKSEYLNFGLDKLKISSIAVINGVSNEMAASLESLNIFTTYDLAYSTIFANAHKITYASNKFDSFMKKEIIPSDVMDGGERSENIENAKFEDIQTLKGIGSHNVVDIKKELNISTIYDMANWPPYIAAKEIIGLMRNDLKTIDNEIPNELVPTFNEYAVDKSFYSIYTIDSKHEHSGGEIESAISIEEIINPENPIEEKIRTGRILRYEQSWTPIGLGLGNLLHSLALAPGESTRIAVVDWKRAQRVKTTESISQLESLSNTLVQNRSINEITSAVANEAQTGFSEIDNNTDVTNTGSSNYGIQNMEETLAAAGAGALAGAGAGGATGAVVGGGIGFIAGTPVAGIGAVPGLLAGAAIGGGTGAIIGGTAGGIGAALATADFEASQKNKSLTEVTARTDTESTGHRNVTSEIAQNISERTHQHSSTSRNRRASIVQELSQSESENISTRVVTNYNHMHSLTIQYFEVVQIYRVSILLKKSQDCLFIPFKPIENWTIELLMLFRKEILQSALHSSILHFFTFKEDSIVIKSPTIHNVALEEMHRNVLDLQYSKDNLTKARTILSSWVSDNPVNYWTVPKSLFVSVIYIPKIGGESIGVHEWGGTPEERAKVSFKLILTSIDGNSYDIFKIIEDGEYDKLTVKNIKSITCEYGRISSDWDWENEIDRLQNKYGGINFRFSNDRSESENDFTFASFFKVDKSFIQRDKLIIPLLEFPYIPYSSEILEHLNANTEYYTTQVVKRKNKKLITIPSPHLF